MSLFSLKVFPLTYLCPECQGERRPRPHRAKAGSVPGALGQAAEGLVLSPVLEQTSWGILTKDFPSLDLTPGERPGIFPLSQHLS